MLIKANELSWLPNSVTKGEQIPAVVWESESNNYAGYYNLKTNYIVIVEDEHPEATIAHEFRHHWQDRRGLLADTGSTLDFSLPYNDMIKKYFRMYWHEYDALLFEIKHCKNWYNDWWLRKLTWED